jgi:glycosyltransferase involved in cell wall biosynthesis
MRKASVSIVMATYNGAAFLPRQLESLANQDEAPMELIAADDGSRDDTLDILEAFAARAPFPVTILKNATRLGYSENFLTATAQARGRYIAFCDQDDVWYPDKIARCVDRLERTGAGVCAHALDLIDAKGKALGLLSQGITRDRVHEPLTLEPWGFYLGLALVFRRDLLALLPASERGLDCWAYAEPLSHDRWVTFLAAHFDRIAVIARPLAAYRQHGGNRFGYRRNSLVARLRAAIAGDVARARRLAILSHRRRALLESRAGELRFAPALARWRRLAVIHDERARLYETHALAAKAAVLVRLAGLRAYAAVARGGLGRKRLVQDLVVSTIVSLRHGLRPSAATHSK